MDPASCSRDVDSPFDLLPPEVVSRILNHLPTEEKLQVAPLVCRTWRRLCCSDPLVWQTIDLHDWEDHSKHPHIYDVLARLVPLAGSALRKLDLQFFDYDGLAAVIRGCQGSLEWLRLGHSDMTRKWAREFAPMLSKLKHLELLECYQITRAGVVAFCQSCPCLTHLSVDPYDNDNYHTDMDDELIEEREPSALKIQLQELLFIITILKKCPNLESLTFFGKWIDFNVNQLSDKTVRMRLLKDVRKKYKYLSKARVRRTTIFVGKKYPLCKAHVPFLTKMTRR